jgi:hypothetical protein
MHPISMAWIPIQMPKINPHWQINLRKQATAGYEPPPWTGRFLWRIASPPCFARPFRSRECQGIYRRDMLCFLPALSVAVTDSFP